MPFGNFCIQMRIIKTLDDIKDRIAGCELPIEHLPEEHRLNVDRLLSSEKELAEWLEVDKKAKIKGLFNTVDYILSDRLPDRLLLYIKHVKPTDFSEHTWIRQEIEDIYKIRSFKENDDVIVTYLFTWDQGGDIDPSHLYDMIQEGDVDAIKWYHKYDRLRDNLNTHVLLISGALDAKPETHRQLWDWDVLQNIVRDPTLLSAVLEEAYTTYDKAITKWALENGYLVEPRLTEVLQDAWKACNNCRFSNDRADDLIDWAREEKLMPPPRWYCRDPEEWEEDYPEWKEELYPWQEETSPWDKPSYTKRKVTEFVEMNSLSTACIQLWRDQGHPISNQAHNTVYKGSLERLSWYPRAVDAYKASLCLWCVQDKPDYLTLEDIPLYAILEEVAHEVPEFEEYLQ